MDRTDRKICPTCNRELPLFQFCKDKTQKDGHARTCKQCRSNYYYYTKIKRAL